MRWFWRLVPHPHIWVRRELDYRGFYGWLCRCRRCGRLETREEAMRREPHPLVADRRGR